jgi:bis(5'-nucleosyl)-tetraphosphatase (symmetrical)
MATYIIGDVQGCYVELQNLLELIDYNPDRDQLGFVGDLVNRGPHSLAVLRFLKNLKNPRIVLGNHDFYLLMIGYNLVSPENYNHTLYPILEAKDRYELLDFLRHQPLLYFDEHHHALLVHAGVPPQWNLPQALQYAFEVESTLQSAKFQVFLRNLFGNEPNSWHESLTGQARLRYICNAFTRMRYCTEDGTLDFHRHSPQDHSDPNFKPWFDWPRAEKNCDILFGHWAMLGGKCDQPHCYALDTGCAWGESLTALRVEDKKRFTVPCIEKK